MRRVRGAHELRVVELHQQAVAQVARTDPGRLEFAHDFDRLLGQRDRHRQLAGDRLGGLGQATVLVEREHDVLDDGDELRVGLLGAHLGHQVVGQGHRAARGVLQGLELLVLVVAGVGRAALPPVRLGARFELVDLGRELALQAVFVGIGSVGCLAFAGVALGALRVVLALEEDVLLQFLFDLVLQLDQRQLQDLHGLNHLRRLDQSLFCTQGLGQA